MVQLGELSTDKQNHCALLQADWQAWLWLWKEGLFESCLELFDFDSRPSMSFRYRANRWEYVQKKKQPMYM